MKYSPLGSKKMISQTFNGDCLKTTFERENELKSEWLSVDIGTYRKPPKP